MGVALLLFVGRWSAEWYTDQLWAGSVSPGASGALRRRALLGLGLGTIATLVATLWWAGNLRVAHRVALRLPTEAPGGNPRFRRLIAAQEARCEELIPMLTGEFHTQAQRALTLYRACGESMQALPREPAREELARTLQKLTRDAVELAAEWAGVEAQLQDDTQ
ncbi:MAG: hypothetical protein AABY91_06515, partial [Gemmatimonadota bacterium]